MTLLSRLAVLLLASSLLLGACSSGGSGSGAGDVVVEYLRAAQQDDVERAIQSFSEETRQDVPEQFLRLAIETEGLFLRAHRVEGIEVHEVIEDVPGKADVFLQLKLEDGSSMEFQRSATEIEGRWTVDTPLGEFTKAREAL